jgi:signal transduction histidine kinase
MRNWRQRARGSVRLRVTLLAAGVFAGTLLVAAVLLLRVLEGVLVDDVRDTHRTALETQAQMLLTQGVPAGTMMVTAPTSSAVQLPLAGQEPVVVVFRDPYTAKRLAAGDRIAIVGPTSDVMFETPVPAAGEQLLGIEGRAESFNVAALDVGGGLLVTASPVDEVQYTIDATRRVMLVVGPGLVALVAGLAWLLVGRALRPVHDVTSRVAAIGSHSLHERVPVPPSGDEVAELAQTMNGMLGRLESATATNRRLVSDASHELRTPVTVIRTELEVARRTPAPDWGATSEAVLDEVDRLQGLVDDLLLLARSDERGLAVATVSAIDVAHEVAARRRARPVHVDVPAGPDAQPPPAVAADGAALTRALDHLVDNAVRHAASEVQIVVAAEDGEVAIHVDDDGPGIAAGDRSRVTQRFVRLDDGRARDAGGAGLGLAVATDVAVALGGRLAIGDSPLGGARVSVNLLRA